VRARATKSSQPADPASRPTGRQRLKAIAVRVLLWYMVWISVAAVFARSILFPRHYAQVMESPGEGVPGLERLWLETDQGKVEGWFVPGEGVSADSPGPVAFFAHGNAEVIDDYPYVLEPYRKRGVSIMLVEFRGYGRSAGSPSQKRITEDYIRFYDMIAARPEVDKSRIIFHGRSVGTGVVCALAAERKPAALILQSPFKSVRSMMARYLIPPFLCFDPFDNEAVIRSLDRPILILHGNRDEVIPFSHGQGLSRLVEGCKFHEYDCGHNDFPIDSDRYWEDVMEFLTDHDILAPLPGEGQAAGASPRVQTRIEPCHGY
jgi:fermentation-respiration switch protein FrsA (DUF1100 family)